VCVCVCVCVISCEHVPYVSGLEINDDKALYKSALAKFTSVVCVA